LDLPLFPGYVFAHIAARDRLRVLEVPGVVRFVCFDGQPQALPDADVEALRNGLSMKLKVHPYPYLKVGRRVRIKYGPLQGVEGILVRKKDSVRLVISLDLIMRSIAVEVDGFDIEAL
jgi:transcription antitermination factor NusG